MAAASYCGGSRAALAAADAEDARTAMPRCFDDRSTMALGLVGHVRGIY